MTPIEILTEKLNAKGLEVTEAEAEAIAVRCAGTRFFVVHCGHTTFREAVAGAGFIRSSLEGRDLESRALKTA